MPQSWPCLWLPQSPSSRAVRLLVVLRGSVILPSNPPLSLLVPSSPNGQLLLTQSLHGVNSRPWPYAALTKPELAVRLLDPKRHLSFKIQVIFIFAAMLYCVGPWHLRVIQDMPVNLNRREGYQGPAGWTTGRWTGRWGGGQSHEWVTEDDQCAESTADSSRM